MFTKQPKQLPPTYEVLAHACYEHSLKAFEHAKESFMIHDWRCAECDKMRLHVERAVAMVKHHTQLSIASLNMRETLYHNLHAGIVANKISKLSRDSHEMVFGSNANTDFIDRSIAMLTAGVRRDELLYKRASS